MFTRLLGVGSSIGLVAFAPGFSVFLLLRGVVVVLVHGRDESLVVLGVLKVTLGGNSIAAGLGVACEREIFVMNLHGGSPNLHIRAVALENAVGRISASSIERSARPVARAFGVLVFIHDSCCWLMCGSVTGLCRQLRQFRKIRLAGRIILWILLLSNCFKISKCTESAARLPDSRHLFGRENQVNRRPSKFPRFRTSLRVRNNSGGQVRNVSGAREIR